MFRPIVGISIGTNSAHFIADFLYTAMNLNIWLRFMHTILRTHWLVYLTVTADI